MVNVFSARALNNVRIAKLSVCVQVVCIGLLGAWGQQQRRDAALLVARLAKRRLGRNSECNTSASVARLYHRRISVIRNETNKQNIPSASFNLSISNTVGVVEIRAQRIQSFVQLRKLGGRTVHLEAFQRCQTQDLVQKVADCSIWSAL